MIVSDKSRVVYAQDIDRDKIRILGVVGLIGILLSSMINPVAVLMGTVFVISMNYTLPLTKKDNLIIIAWGVCLGIITPLTLSFIFKM